MIQEHLSQQQSPFADERIIDQIRSMLATRRTPRDRELLPPEGNSDTTLMRVRLLRELIMVDLWYRWREVGEADCATIVSSQGCNVSKPLDFDGQCAHICLFSKTTSDVSRNWALWSNCRPR